MAINKEFFVEGIPFELSLFDLPPIQTGLVFIVVIRVRPFNLHRKKTYTLGSSMDAGLSTTMSASSSSISTINFILCWV